MKLSVRHLGYVRDKDPRLYEALSDIKAGIERMARQIVANPSGDVPAPPQISSLAVSANSGMFTLTIYDNNPVLRGIEYFVEYAGNTSFNGAYCLSLGPSRNWVGFLGSPAYYFRAYSQYPSSPPSPPVYFGGATPSAVTGGGTINPSYTNTPGAGSGTAKSDGYLNGAGYGYNPTRGNVRLK